MIVGLMAALSLVLHQPPLHASLPLGGPGPLFNIPPFTRWDEQAVVNASAHAGWSVAVTAVGALIGSRAFKDNGACKGALIAGGTWVLGNLIRETWFHPGDGPEERTDVATHVLPTALVVLWQCH